mmetsp:Transcript_58861/g.138386  ORF Transcript_58861/g.138386 Transcript_58861/m.138386 type:complete len:296 (+) Transcript_58861:1953-2840(+)
MSAPGHQPLVNSGLGAPSLAQDHGARDTARRRPDRSHAQLDPRPQDCGEDGDSREGARQLDRSLLGPPPSTASLPSGVQGDDGVRRTSCGSRRAGRPPSDRGAESAQHQHLRPIRALPQAQTTCQHPSHPVPADVSTETGDESKDCTPRVSAPPAVRFIGSKAARPAGCRTGEAEDRVWECELQSANQGRLAALRQLLPLCAPMRAVPRHRPRRVRVVSRLRTRRAFPPHDVVVLQVCAVSHGVRTSVQHGGRWRSPRVVRVQRDPSNKWQPSKEKTTSHHVSKLKGETRGSGAG